MMVKYYKRIHFVKVVTATALFFLLGMFRLSQAQVNDTLGTGIFSSPGAGPVIRSSASDTRNYSCVVYLYTEDELTAKGIFPGSVLHALSWQRGLDVPILANGATATWKVAIKAGGSTQNYSFFGPDAFTYRNSGFNVFGQRLFNDHSGNLPAQAGSWIRIDATSAFTYTGGSLEVLCEWTLLPLGGASGSPTTTGAMQWYATALSSNKTVSATAEQTITAVGTTLIGQTIRPNLVINYTKAPECSGVPEVLTFTDATSFCAGESRVNLNVATYTSMPGLSLQWQSSLAGQNNFTDIANANSVLLKDTIREARDYRVVLRCAASGLSSNSAIKSITIAAPLPVPVTESFSMGVQPDCWTITTSSAIPSLGGWRFNGVPSGGAAMAINGRTSGTYAWTSNAVTAADKVLAMPPVNLSGLTRPVLKFDFFSNYLTAPGSEGTLKVQVWDNNSWNTLLAIKGSKATWRVFYVPLDAYLNQTVRIRFLVDDTQTKGSGNDILLDEVQLMNMPLCPPPTDLFVSNINHNSAMLDWTENGPATQWQVAYDTGIVNVNSAKRLYTSQKPFNINTLLPVSVYTVYVRSICGPGDTSTWSSIPQPFSTACPPNFATPYMENFSKWPANCWELKTGELNTTLLSSVQNYWRSANWMHATLPVAKAAEFSVSFGNDVKEWLISPAINLGTNQKHQLDFDIYFLNYATLGLSLGLKDTFFVVVSADNGNSWLRDNILHYRTIGNTPVPGGNCHVTLDLSKYSGVIKIGFFNKMPTFSASAAVGITQFTVSPSPSCRVPINTYATRLSHEGALLSWTETGTAQQWEVEYGPAGFQAGNGTKVIVNVPRLQAGGLSALTHYDYYVRSICGSADTSARTGKGSFKTLCVQQIPYREQFDATVTLPECMSRAYNYPLSGRQFEVVSNLSSMARSKPNFLRIESSGSLKNMNDWVHTPGLQLHADSFYTLSFAYRSQVVAGGFDAFEVRIGNYNNLDSTGTKVLFEERFASANWDSATLNFRPAVTGVHYIGFYCTSETMTYGLMLDDIEVVKAAACYPPTHLNVSSTTADEAVLSWQENNNATTWKIEYGIKGFTPGTGDLVQTTNNPHTLQQLNDATSYDFYVTSFCSGTDSSEGSKAASFVTQCSLPELFLGADTTACAPYVLVVPQDSSYSYQWSTGAQVNSVTVHETGTYWLHIEKANGCGVADTIVLELEQSPVVDSIVVVYLEAKTVRFKANAESDLHSLNWFFGDGNSSTEAQPDHAYAEAGTYRVLLVAGNDCGTDSVWTDVSVTADLSIGIKGENQLWIYPNPAGTYLVVEDKNGDGLEELALINIAGALVYRENQGSKSRVQINTTDLPTGIYILRMKRHNSVGYRKIEIIR